MRPNNFQRAGNLSLAIVALLLTCASYVWAGSYQVLHNFNDSDGGGFAPEAPLIFDSNGNLYGTTVAGGSGCAPPGCGTVFTLVHNSDGSWTYRVLHSFNGSDGGFSYAGLVFDGRGNLYGTTKGYNGSGGNVFELSPGSGGVWTESVLHAFTGGWDGGQPLTGLTLDRIGNVYGTTSLGGASNSGVVFALGHVSILNWHELVLHAFAGGNDGSAPNGPLVFDASGNLYGTTFGDTTHAGTVFRLTPNRLSFGWTETILYEFQGIPYGSGPDGANPAAGLIFDGAGNLYGTTEFGGAVAGGTVFKLTPNPGGSWTESVLHDFQGGNDGNNPAGGVIVDAAGSLYGTTLFGGPNTHGTVFKLTPSGGGHWTETVLYGFAGRLDGGWPGAGVILDSAGHLYGTAVLGGTGGGEHGGVVFEVTP